MAPRSLLFAASLLSGVFAQTQQGQFNQVINLNGDMNLNSVTFPDGSRVETFSQSQQQLLVNQNQAPLPGNQVTGSTGQPFIALTQNSMVIQTNGATDLVGGQIELPINQQNLQSMNLNMDNTYVAKLSPDRQSWMIMETIKSVNGSDNTVRIQKMNMIDGEYISLGRQTQTTSLALQQFSSNPSQAFNITGSGIQESEFTDGFRMSVRASDPMTINTNVVNGIATTMLADLPPGTNSINNYRYLVQTNLAGVVPNINRMVAVVQLPINPVRLQSIATQMGASANSNVRLSIAQRGILINPGGAVAGSGSISTGTNKKRQNSNSGSGSNSNSDSNSNSNTGSDTNSNSNSNSNTGSDSNSNSNGSESGTSNGSSGSSTTGTTNSGSSINGGTPVASQLLLAPTFTPITANAVLDQMNGRLAIPVAAVDGEFIITVQMANGETTTGTTGTTGTTSGTTGTTSGTTGTTQGQGTLQGAGTTGTTGTGSIQGQEPATAGTGSIQGQEPATAGTGSIQGQEPTTAGTGSIQGQEPATAGTGSIQGQEPATAGTGSIQGQEPETAGSTGTSGTLGAEPATAGTAGTLDKRQIIAPGALAGLASSAAPQAASAAPQVASPAPQVASAAPQVASPAPAAPQAASPVPQAAAPAPAAQAPAPAAQQPATAASAGTPDNEGGVTVSMAWVNMMAAIAQQGLPVNVDQLMNELSAQQGTSTTQTAIQGAGGDVGAGLLERRWVA